MPLLVLIGLAVLAFPFVMPIVAWVANRRLRQRIDALEEVIQRQRQHLHTLEREVHALRGTTIPPAEAPAKPVVREEVPAEAATMTEQPARPPEEPRVPPPIVAPVSDEGPREEIPPAEQPPPAPFERALPAMLAAREPLAENLAGPPPPRYPKTEAPPPSEPFDWESLIGVKLFSAIAGIALVIAAIFFLRYSMEHGWLEPPVRVAIGVIVAVGLLIVCEWKAARDYPATANALDAAAIAILFATFFSAHALWHLIPASVAFALLALVTTIAVLLAIRRESLFIAVLGLVGGFSTPALLSTGENRPIPLFAYLLLLNIGLAWVAYTRRWPMLGALSLALTTLYQWAWVFTYLSVSQLPLATGIFLLFPVASFIGISLARPRREAATPGDAAFERTSLVTAALPLLFALYLAAVPEYGPYAGLLFGFLLLLDAGLLAIGLARRDELLHASSALATMLVFVVWLATSYSADAYRTVLLLLALFVTFFATAPLVASRAGRPFAAIARRAVYAAPLLLVVPAVLAITERAGESPLLFGVLFALTGLLAWRAVVTDRGAVYFIAGFFAVAAQALWSSVHLDLEHVTMAVAIYGAFGVLSFAVPVVARRAGHPLRPRYASGIVLIASLALQLFLATQPGTAPAALWGMALLIAILDAGLFVESAAERLPGISIAGSLLSWCVLAAWWSRSAAAVGLLPSLLVIVLLALVMLAGHAWTYAKHDGRRPFAPEGTAETASDVIFRGFRTGLFLGLVGHLFLLYIALNRVWSVPPWPMFASLGVLTLAVSITSLVTRVDRLHAGSVAAAMVVVLAWTSVAQVSPWPTIALVVGGVICAFALLWTGVAPRAADEERRESGERRGGRRGVDVRAVGAAIALFLMELVTIAAGAANGAAALAALITSHALALAILLALTWRERWPLVAPLTVFPAALAVLSWDRVHGTGETWTGLLLLSCVFYAIFTAYPFVLGRRVGHNRDPHITAVLGAALFFFGARRAFLLGGLDWMMGAIPVVEGGVLALLLRQLLGMEEPGARDLGRLALVGGAALAFVTVAIPLQLEHQWITIGWALEGAALCWLYSRIAHKGLLWSGAALLAVVFARLALNPEIFQYEPRGSLRIFNWYLYTYVICAASCFASAWFLSATNDRIGIRTWRVMHVLSAAGAILLFIGLNIEIADFYATGPEIMFRFGVTVAQDLTYTIGWLVFGMVMLAAGISLKSHAARVAALGLLAITTFKAFLYDLGSLGGLYRVASLVGLAVSLTLVSLALQRFVLRPARGH